MKFNATIVSADECPYFLPDQAICAIYHDTTDACHPGGYPEGDVGGPLVTEAIDDQQTMVGLVRNPRGCPTILNDFPEVYTKISPFVDWINQTIKEQ